MPQKVVVSPFTLQNFHSFHNVFCLKKKRNPPPPLHDRSWSIQRYATSLFGVLFPKASTCYFFVSLALFVSLPLSPRTSKVYLSHHFPTRCSRFCRHCSAERESSRFIARVEEDDDEEDDDDELMEEDLDEEEQAMVARVHQDGYEKFDKEDRYTPTSTRKRSCKRKVFFR